MKETTVNGIDVFDNEILTLSDNGKIVLYADAYHYEKLVKKYMKKNGFKIVKKAYQLLMETGEFEKLEFGSIFINEITY